MSFLNQEESTSLDFDTGAVAPRAAPDPLPNGDYLFLIEKSIVKSNKNGDGKVVSLTLKAQDEPHVGRVVFDNMNVQHPKELVQQIAREQLAGLLAALNMTGERDMSKVAGKFVVARLGTQPAQGQYDARNVVKGYKPATAGAVASAAPAAAKSAPGFMSKGPTLK